MTSELEPQSADRPDLAIERRREQPFLFLALIALCIAHPLQLAGHANPHVIEIGVALVLLAALWSAPFIVRLLIGAYAVLRIVHYVGPAFAAPIAELTADVATVVILGSLFGLAVQSALLETSLAFNRICGALNGYLLLGALFAKAFLMLHAVDPSTLSATGEMADRLQHPALCQDVVIYFSFVTLTTIGYGDVIPISVYARTLAWIEVMIGQFYLVVVVAGLVGSVSGNSAHRPTGDAPNPPLRS